VLGREQRGQVRDRAPSGNVMSMVTIYINISVQVRHKFNYNGNENVCSISVRYGHEANDPELFLDVQQLVKMSVKGRVVETKQSP
jgi:hypothetical protein